MCRLLKIAKALVLKTDMITWIKGLYERIGKGWGEAHPEVPSNYHWGEKKKKKKGGGAEQYEDKTCEVQPS